MTIPEQKTQLRREVQARLKTVTAAERLAAAELVGQHVRANPIWQSAEIVLFYAARWDELDLWPLLLEAMKQGKQVALPQYVAERDAYQACRIQDLEGDLGVGHYGIREPRAGREIVSLKRLDLILVPGLAYSVAGVRLGRGKGYYDRMLAGASGIWCGIGHDWQFGLPVPTEAHDIRLHCIRTPKLWREFAPPSTAGE
ncbi:MAG: 5-formyltetrahydrofolate cyclo-ligase [Verrucomicrobiota bacterium]